MAGSTPVLIWNPAGRLDPIFGKAKSIPVNLQGDSATIPLVYSAGQLLGEVLASQGLFGFYRPSLSDGTQNAKGILQYRASVLGAGGVAGAIAGVAPGVGGEWVGASNLQGSMMYQGTFDLSKLVGLDSTALELLAGVIVSGALGTDQQDSIAQTGGTGTFAATIPSVTVNGYAYPAVTLLAQSATITAANLVIAINAGLVAAGIPAYVTATGGALGTAPIVVTWHGAYGQRPFTLSFDNTGVSGGTVASTRTAGVLPYGIVKFG